MVKAEDLPGPPGSDFGPSKMYVWVRGLEGKINNITREVDVLKNDFIKRANDLNKEFKTLGEDLMELRHQQEKMDQKMVLIIKELKQTAGAEEVMTLKKYVEFWNPLNFVTQKDLEKAVEGKLQAYAKPAEKVLVRKE